MSYLKAGDLVRSAATQCEMLIIGSADEDAISSEAAATWFCVWERSHLLFEEVFSEDKLILVRQERRRIPRGGALQFPSRDS